MTTTIQPRNPQHNPHSSELYPVLEREYVLVTERISSSSWYSSGAAREILENFIAHFQWALVRDERNIVLTYTQLEQGGEIRITSVDTYPYPHLYTAYVVRETLPLEGGARVVIVGTYLPKYGMWEFSHPRDHQHFHLDY
jgi:hypothetical protein